MIDQGVSNFLAQVRTGTEKGEATRAGGFKSVMLSMIDPLAERIEAYLHAPAVGQGPVRVRLAGGDPRVTAFLAIKTIIDTVAHRRRVPLTTLSVTVGRAIELEARLGTFKTEKPDAYGATLSDLVKNKQSRNHRRKVLTFAMTKFGVDPLAWPEEDRALVGVRLITWFTELSGVVKVEFISEEGKPRYTVSFDEAALNDIREIDALTALGFPRLMPCVVPPKDWSSPFNGGYHTPELRCRYPLVKPHNRSLSRAYLQELRDRGGQLSQVYEAVNALQRTPWKVNARVLDVLQQFWQQGVSLAGLPDVVPLDIPPKPHDIAENEESRRVWRKKAHTVYTHNAANKSKRIQVAQAIKTATKFRDETALYFPYQLDFRGRTYALPYFNPQGADWVKALLTFGIAKPIDNPVSRGWLAIHGANCFGEVDKENFDARIAWVEAKQDAILRVANDPSGDRWWTEADKPWQFLAWCFEWAGLVQHERGPLRGVEPFLSSLPVTLDGSCSGLQHYSAILRDERGARSTNLTPAEKPSDLYADVAARVVVLLSEKVGQQGEDAAIAKAWLESGLVDRKLTKRPVMIVPYSGTLSACRKYVFERLREVQHPFGDDTWRYVKLVSELIWKAIGEVVTSAHEGMKFLKQCAGVLAKDGLPVSWTTPVGFPVVQCYPDLEPYKIETTIGDKLVARSPRIRLVLVEETGELDANEQRLGIAPNFIHSMDAAALMAYILVAKDNGIDHFATVHDSFATHAADTEMSAQCLRHAFVDMYETNDVFAQFREDCARALPPEKASSLPTPPQRGSLSLSSVLDSDYFFA